MQQIKEKLSWLILFIIAVLWGNVWTTEILACPEWWFIGVNALLFGTGIFLKKFIPHSWRLIAAGILLLLTLTADSPLLFSIMLPVISGLWYSCHLHLALSWQTSRTFCAGLLIGGILAGVFTSFTEIPQFLAAALLLHGGLQGSFANFLDTALLAGFCFFAAPATAEPPPPPPLDTGTVISAFALIPDDPQSERIPKIAFIGGTQHNLFNSAMTSPDGLLQILNPAANIFFLPELPATIPAETDLIAVSALPPSGKSGAAALVKSLAHNGVLLMPTEYCKILPQYSWYIMPGSDGKYAAMSPDKELVIVPDLLDAQLIRHFADTPDAAPLGGALAGMLVDFENRKLILPQPQGKDFYRFIHCTLAAGFFLLMIWIARIRHGGKDNWRIILNCAGFSMQNALLLPLISKGLPAIPAVTSLVIVCVLAWVFRRPVTQNNVSLKKSRRFTFSGIAALLLLLVSFFGHWQIALLAMISGGYFFAELDGELCGERNVSTESIRFLGIAAGAFAANYLQSSGTPFGIFFIIVILLRGWSFFRN